MAADRADGSFLGFAAFVGEYQPAVAAGPEFAFLVSADAQQHTVSLAPGALGSLRLFSLRRRGDVFSGGFFALFGHFFDGIRYFADEGVEIPFTPLDAAQGRLPERRHVGFAQHVVDLRDEFAPLRGRDERLFIFDDELPLLKRLNDLCLRGGRSDTGGLFEDFLYLRVSDIKVNVVHGVK